MDHIRKDKDIKKAILGLSFVRERERNIPTGILNIGVSIAIPGKPKFLRKRTTRRFQEVKTRLVLFGNIRLNQ